MRWILLVLDDVPLLIYSALIFMILREFVPLRFKNRLLWAAEIVCLTVMCNAIVYPDEITGTVGNLLGLIPILIIFHKGEWYMKVTAALIVYPAMMAVSYLLQDIGQKIWEYGFDTQMSSVGENLLYVIFRGLRAPVWYVIYRYVKIWVPRAIRMLTRRMWLLLSGISLASFIGIIIIIYECGYDNSYLAWPSCIATLVTSMGCCYICTYMAKIVRSDMELETMQYQKSYYQELENSQETVRRMRHDMKNHLGVAAMLLKDGHYEKAEEYLSGLNQEFAARTKTYCSDPVVNAVLNAKMQRAQEAGITCEYQVDLKEPLPIEDIDLCALFANTLDNAIEACMKISETDRRRIVLKARCVNGNFSFEIENTKENAVTEKKGNFETDKEDRHSHGIGLRSVRQIVQKYNGEIRIDYTAEIFRVTVFLAA